MFWYILVIVCHFQNFCLQFNFNLLYVVQDGCEDSGATSPKSSVSSSSMDSHLINLRLQPIPEEVLLQAASTSLKHTMQQQDAVARPSQGSVQEAMFTMDDDGVNVATCSIDTSISRRKLTAMENEVNVGSCTSMRDVVSSSQIGLTSNIICDADLVRNKALSSSGSACVSSSSDNVSDCSMNCREASDAEAAAVAPLPDVLRHTSAACDVSSTMDEEPSLHVADVNILDIMKETKTSNVNVLVKENLQNNELLYDSEKYAKCDKVKLKDSLENNLHRSSSLKRMKENNLFNLSKSCKSSSSSNSSIGSNSDELSVNGKRCNHLLEEGAGGRGVECAGDASLSKRMRLDEKNIQHALDRCQQQQHATCSHTGNYHT